MLTSRQHNPSGTKLSVAFSLRSLLSSIPRAVHKCELVADLELVCRSYLRTTAHDSKSAIQLVNEATSMVKTAAGRPAKSDPERALGIYEEVAYRLFAAASHPQQDGPGQAALREVLTQLPTILSDVSRLKVK